MADLGINPIKSGGWIVFFRDKSFACWRWDQVLGLLKDSDVSFDPSLERDKQIPKDHKHKYVKCNFYPYGSNTEICEVELMGPNFHSDTVLCRTKEEMIKCIDKFIWGNNNE